MSDERRFSAVEVLTSAHRVAGFNCGSHDETIWLQHSGLAAENSRSSRTYVVRRPSDDRVVAFHTLTAGAVLPVRAPRRLATSVESYPISVVILTRLGVDLSEHGQRLGCALLVDALQRVNAAADIVGVHALLVHAPNQMARDFCQAVAEFEASPTDPFHLFLLIKDLRRSFT